MGNIVLLDDLTINKIAAGEVIERPASVVKEMVENSIDAGANNITIEIKNGGISYIRITDNGKGIERDDVELAFERHATSKIRSADDLQDVKSMGFRGEALASIAAIANVEIITKTKENNVGTRAVVEGGNILSLEDAACMQGTAITVKNLFYNTPVRYKFLKKDFTEAGYIEDVVARIALIHPEIAIKFINTGKTLIQTNGNGDLKTVIYSIYGKDIAENLIPVSYEYDYIKINGMIGRPNIARSNRSYQMFFVNKRYVKDKTLTSAVEQAFKGMLPIGKFAFLVLNVDINTNKVDVNVHPAKLEVRFEEENIVFKSMYHVIKDSLLKENLIPEREKTKESNIATKEAFKIEVNKTEMKKNAEIAANEIDIMQKLKEIQINNLKEENKDNSEIQLTVKGENLKENYNLEAQVINNEKIQNKTNIEIGIKKVESSNEFIETNYENIKENTEEIIEKNEEKNKEDEEKKNETNCDNIKEIDEKNINEENSKISFKEMYKQLFGKEPYGGRRKVEETITKENEIYETFSEIKDNNISVFDETETYKKMQYKFIGIVFNTYILLEIDSKLYIMDQHAAHERIMYERVKKNFYNNNNKDCQMLLLPDIITLTFKEMNIAKENFELFNKAGFTVEEFGENTIKISGVPNVCIDLDTKELFMETLDAINTVSRTAMQEKEEKFIATIACKAAVKANMKLSKEEVDSLMNKLLELPNPFTCPHGRPTVIKISKYEIEKKFSRK